MILMIHVSDWQAKLIPANHIVWIIDRINVIWNNDSKHEI